MNSNPLSKTTQIAPQTTPRQKQAQQRRKQYMEEKIRLWEMLKSQGLNDAACAKICNTSRATFYRYKKRITDLENGIPLPTRARLRQNRRKWGEPEEQLVAQVREQSPTFGKKKITVILKRDHGINLSVSTVGRITAGLLDTGAIQKSRAAPTARRRQIRNGYAQRKPFKEYSKATIGEDVQIDQTTINMNGRTYKLFQVWDRCSKHLFSHLYSDAKSATARRFLRKMVKTIPFKIKSIQVDGGSEFGGKFEQACATLNTPLFVIALASPKHNGGVERANRTIKEELYHQIQNPLKNITEIRRQRQKVIHKYNNFRPHNNLAGLTPMQYIQNFYLNNKKESQYS